MLVCVTGVKPRFFVSTLFTVRNSFVINEGNIVTAAPLRISFAVKTVIAAATAIYFNAGEEIRATD